jgi:hypothetical protein
MSLMSLRLGLGLALVSALAPPLARAERLERTRLAPSFLNRAHGVASDLGKIEVELDHFAREIRLAMFRKTLELEPFDFFKATITQSYDHCGTRIYLSSADERPWGGRLTEMTLYDHRHRMCGDGLQGVSVVLRTRDWDAHAHKDLTAESEFAGNALEVVPVEQLVEPVRSKLTELQVDPHLLKGHLLDGEVLWDSGRNIVRLSIRYNLGSELRLTLGVESYETDSCGSLVIVASRSAEASGGRAERVVIKDHQRRYCPPFSDLQTEVLLETSERRAGEVLKTVSRFAGSAFANP